MKRLIFRNLKQRKSQVISMVLTIGIAATVFVSLFMLYGGMQRGVQLNEERSGAELIVVPSDVRNWVSDSELLFTGAPVTAYFDSSVLDEITSLEGVENITGQFYGTTLTAACCSTGEESRIIGFDASTDFVILPFCQEDITSLATGEIIIGSKVGGFESGTGTLLGEEVTVVGHLVETGSSLDFSIFMGLDDVRTLAANTEGFRHFWDTYGEPETLLSAVLLNVDSNETSVITAINKIEGVSVIQRTSVVEESQETLNTVFVIMLVAGIALVIASALQLFARYFSSVWDRKAELALYRALGASVGDLRKIICGEAFILTGVGCAIGIVLGVMLYVAGYNFLQAAESFPFSALPLPQVIFGIVGIVLVMFILAAISIIAPLRQVSRVDAALAMQQVDIG